MTTPLHEIAEELHASDEDEDRGWLTDDEMMALLEGSALTFGTFTSESAAKRVMAWAERVRMEQAMLQACIQNIAAVRIDEDGQPLFEPIPENRTMH